MQAIVLGATVAGVGVWIGGIAGACALLTGVAFLAAPTVVYALQMGNFQTTAFAGAVVALILLSTGRIRTGAPLLAYVAASKVFPGILVVYLAAARTQPVGGCERDDPVRSPGGAEMAASPVTVPGQG